jgi:sec-independent protein translocase protein TatB
VFGLSFGELMVLLIVSVVVLGPKELPRYLRKAGEWAGRLRRLAFEMREKSGIDEVLRTEGIDKDIAEIRRLARGELGQVAAAVRSTTDALRPQMKLPGTDAAATTPADAAGPTVLAGAPAAPATMKATPAGVAVEREREYPREGADSYGALPDTAVVYDGSLPASPLAGDALYARGEAA